MAAPRIVAIGTAVPETVVPQSLARSVLLGQPGIGRVAQRLIAAAVDGSAIEQRRTVIREFAAGADAGEPEPRDGAGLHSLRSVDQRGSLRSVDQRGSLRSVDQRGSLRSVDQRGPVFYDAAANRMLRPTTGARNAVYAREAGPLALAAARAALASASGLAAADVTHVVTVSCTGFAAPGVDYELVRGLGLRSSTARSNIGFMGCHGAFPALRAAVDACRAAPGAVVLVVCVELCTLHLRSSEDPEQIVSGAVFGDGAAAALVTARADAGGARSVRVDALHSELSADSPEALTWAIGDHGFDLRLSSYVPKLLEAELGDALAPLWPSRDWGAIERWAVHPGGRAILDRTQHVLGLGDEQLAPSRAVLRDLGNMSSPTVLFVLDRVLAEARPGERVLATAFGPGLTVESALMTVEP